MATIQEILHSQLGQSAGYDYAFSGWDQLVSAYKSGQLGQLIGSLDPAVRDSIKGIYNGPTPRGSTLAQELGAAAGSGLASNRQNAAMLPQIMAEFPEAAVLVATQPRGRKNFTEYINLGPLLAQGQALPNDPNRNSKTGQVIANNPAGGQTPTYTPPATTAPPAAPAPSPIPALPATPPLSSALPNQGAAQGPSLPNMSPTRPVPAQTPDGLTPNLEREKLQLDIWETWQRLRIAEQLGLTTEAGILQRHMDTLRQQEQVALGNVNGTPTLERERFEFARDLELSNQRANPRNLAASLMMLGLPQGGASAGEQRLDSRMGMSQPAQATQPAQAYMWPDASRGVPGMMSAQVMTPVNTSDPAEVARWNALRPEQAIPAPMTATQPVGSSSAQVGRFLQGTPMVRKAFSSVGLDPSTYNAGNNPEFSFTAGRHWNAREALASDESTRNLREGLVSFSGGNWADHVNDFEQHRPKGKKASLTSYL